MGRQVAVVLYVAAMAAVTVEKYRGMTKQFQRCRVRR